MLPLDAGSKLLLGSKVPPFRRTPDLMIQAVPRSSGGGGTEEEEEEMERGTVHIFAHCDVVWARCEGLRSDLRVAYEKTAENKGEVVSYCVLCLSHHYS